MRLAQLVRIFEVATIVGALVLAAATASAQNIKGHWEASTPFPMPMEEPVGAVVDGKLYVIQGLTEGGFQPMGVVYVFDPATKVWNKKNPMPEPYVHHAMTAAVNGKIYRPRRLFAAREGPRVATGRQRLGIHAGYRFVASDQPPAEQTRRRRRRSRQRQDLRNRWRDRAPWPERSRHPLRWQATRYVRRHQ